MTKFFPLLAGIVLATALASNHALAAAERLSHRWLYLMTNLQVKENVPKAEALLQRAAKAGYNGVVLADYKLNVLDRVPDHYFVNARQFKAAADKLDLEVIPAGGRKVVQGGIPDR